MIPMDSDTVEAPPKPKHAAEILHWTPLHRGTLARYAKVELPSGLIINDVAIIYSERGPAALGPVKPLVDAVGAVPARQQPQGSLPPGIVFHSDDLRRVFSRGVIAALLKTHPAR